MIVRNSTRLTFLVGPLILLLYISFYLFSHHGPNSRVVEDVTEPALGKTSGDEGFGLLEDQALPIDPQLNLPPSSEERPDQKEEEKVQELPKDDTLDASRQLTDEAPNAPSPGYDGSDKPLVSDEKLIEFPPAGSDAFHHEIFSLSTLDNKYFLIEFGDVETINPNIIPHPTLENTWIIVAQRRNPKAALRFAEISCNAAFQDGKLSCIHRPNVLPVAATSGSKCKGDLAYVDTIFGPHDARVFYGPKNPFIVYGSNSEFTCLGQFIQDLRVLVDDWPELTEPSDFRIGTDLQRPSQWSEMEKNWFPFWDASGQMYLHYDVAPKRAFAQVNKDGSVGPDLAPSAASVDEKCMNKYMPKPAPQHESIHQATNSLKITMCRRSDELCIANESNTFIFTIYQHKTYYNFHSVYEPYIMMFQQRAPFEIYAMSRVPLWIHGRERHPDKDTSDMFYITSMNWKQNGRRYHGYLDDEIIVGFGIEDERTGGIDVLAEALLGNLGLCSDI